MIFLNITDGSQVIIINQSYETDHGGMFSFNYTISFCTKNFRVLIYFIFISVSTCHRQHNSYGLYCEYTVVQCDCQCVCTGPYEEYTSCED